jgi:hypothetical protein
MNNKYIKNALVESTDSARIHQAAKANGIYSEGDSLTRFAQGYMSGCYAMASQLGLSPADMGDCMGIKQREEKDNG